MTPVDWDVWSVDDAEGPRDDGGFRIEARKIVDADTAKAIEFVIDGARIEPSSDPDGPTHEPTFDSFRIDGRDPSVEEQDEHSDDLRAIVWDTLTDSPT